MAVAETGAEENSRGVGEKTWPIAVQLNWELAAYGGLIVLALVLRMWDLGSRMLHHDESLHAVYSWYLYVGRGYKHDPLMHGPFQFHAIALAYYLFGVSDAVARFPAALFGTAIVGLPYFLRDRIGRTAALVAAALLVVSPSFLYFSRFARNDIFSAVWTLATVILIFKYLRGRRTLYLYLLAAVLSLSYSTKEVAFIANFIMVAYLVLLARFDVLKIFLPGSRLSAPTELVLLIGTFTLPQVAALARVLMPVLKLQPGQQLAFLGTALTAEYTLLGAAFIILFAVSVVLGVNWNKSVWLRCALIFWGIFITLHTTFFSNPDGIGTGTVGALHYWLDQQGVRRGDQPWFYYLVLIPLYEFLPVIFGLAAMAYFAVRRHAFAVFLAVWTVVSFLLYGWAAEKMPWLMVHMVLPLILLAAIFIGHLVDAAVARRYLGSKALHYGASVAVLFFALAALWNRLIPDGGALPAIEMQRQNLQTLALVIVSFGVLALAVRFGRDLGAGYALRVAAVVGLLGLMALGIRAAWQVTYYNGDVPVEMMVYTQTSPDVGKVMKEIERVGFRTGTGKDVKVAYDNEVSWPYEWYLRDYRNRSFYGAGTPPTDAPVVLVGFDNDHDARVKPALANYVGQRYKLRWWYPEDYRGMTQDGIVKGLLDRNTRTRLWNYFMYRQTLNPLGSTDFALYVRRDLVEGAWAVTSGGPATAQSAPPAAAPLNAQSIPAAQSWGARGTGPGQFQSPKGVAVGPDGSIYVLDTGNNRIQRFDDDGKFIAAWGKMGQGPGEFNEPWGIAVDRNGHLYVADTWNHRIQRFDADGIFLGQWGSQGAGGADVPPGKFFGPRGIAVDQKGFVYVTDTGNHRIQKFDDTGKSVAVIGQRGAGPGQLAEPVGLAVDEDGTLFVADTWNRRIQKFKPDLSPAGGWMIVGWESISVVNKPFLSLDDRGRVFATDPENNRLLQFDNGALVGAYNRIGEGGAFLGLPTGVTVDAKGRVLVVEGLNNRLLRFVPND